MFLTFEKIKELAKKQGLSLNDLEEKLGVGKNSLYGLKRNQPSAERLQQIADYFHVSTDYLLGRTNNPNIADDKKETFSARGRAIARKYDSASPKKQKYYDRMIAAMFEDDEEDD
ncbi:TPA: helix-turn-helix transcriptional regulator [Streptococcus equi subsp. zooepidemicus]|uniref:helix-turn-helix domain-containing protein n=1 Tax=Streptococcus equi TaxID=1336 RepID=UPI00065875CE|nr:helix-turn-helix transcriptional regulator [Streptococcus equi]HES9067565.1 helix-turn-helix transcriptional regulator [Streptococcus pyogenes]MCD3398383.1 helix-turn-helix domain-containing protein [Streptococcus equi subsp. zooepidemicus]MCD3450584.1 helix-turn-helix domain-containing protein [Streptococcus equi subsp. zooepidemicus]MCD3464560.1 helix-turn-helix domain-containing protein [Streptococcus equi subsp. zooepidemicus]MCD3466993.1 helix-turn-helix domain-containing protein [Stre